MNHVSASRSMLTGVFASAGSALVLVAAAVLLVAGNFDTLNWVELVCFAALFGAILQGGVVSIPTGQVGLRLWLGQPKPGHIYEPGMHWLFPGSDFRFFPSKAILNTDEYTFDSVTCSNRASVRILATVQWRLVDPFLRLPHENEAMAKTYRLCLFNSISDYLQKHAIANSDVDLQRGAIEEAAAASLGKVVREFGETIERVSLSISQVDGEWVKMWRSQEEINSVVDRAANLARLQGVTPEEAIRLLAVKEGWIKATESIHQIRDVRTIIEAITSAIAGRSGRTGT